MKKGKIIVACVLGMIFMTLLWGCVKQSSNVSSEKERNSSASNNAVVTADPSELAGKNYEKVVTQLTDSGFTNIEKVEIDDLTQSSPMEDGEVESVLIDGKDTFKSGDSFSKDVPVTVTYHIVRKIQSPLSAADIAIMELEDIAKAFTDAGFINVSTEELYDLDSGETQRKEVVIGGESVVSKTDSFGFDEVVKVVCHYPAAQYIVNLAIDFTANLLFSKYDVVFCINDDEVATLSHGNDYETNLSLTPGEYELVFYKSGDRSVNGNVYLTVDDNMDVKYKIACYNDRVSVDKIYIQRK